MKRLPKGLGMQHHDIDIKILLLHVLAGWLIASQMTLAHLRMAELTGEVGFTLGMIGAILGCAAGFIAYQKRWFLKDE